MIFRNIIFFFITQYRIGLENLLEFLTIHFLYKENSKREENRKRMASIFTKRTITSKEAYL